jgi:hypothetical protein
MGVWRYGDFEHNGVMEIVVELATTTGRGHLSTILSIIDDKRNKYVKTPISPAALAAVVRGLANFDPQSAFLAALKELQNQVSPDRATFAFLLLAIDGSRAMESRLEQVQLENDPLFYRSIVKAVGSLDINETMARFATSDDAGHRLAVCRISGANPLSFEEVFGTIRKLIDDDDDGVAQSARDGTRHYRDALSARSLLSAITSAEDSSGTCICVDSSLKVGGPGDDYEHGRPGQRQSPEPRV